MHTKEILRKAIDKAQKNGFKLDDKKHAIAIENNIMGFSTEDARVLGYESIIFDIDFAKAFFGTTRSCTGCGEEVPKAKRCPNEQGLTVHTLKEDWQIFIQQMALADDRIKFIESFI